MDEQPVQLFKGTRTPIPATAKYAKRVDYEYERAGTANIFMFTEPLAGWRGLAVRVTKTKVDWAVSAVPSQPCRAGYPPELVSPL